MKRRKTYNKYDKSREEVVETKILTEDEKKRKEEIRKLLAQQLSFMSMFEPYE